MQLKFNRQKSLRDSLMQRLLKLIVFIGIFVVIVFLLRKLIFLNQIKNLILILQMKLSDLNKLFFLFNIFFN